jgi:lysozyme
MASSPRTASAALVLSASTLVGIAVSESYTDTTIIPVPGDVPTYGFGTTTHADGTPLKMGEKTTPPRALVSLLRDAGKFSLAVKRCAPVPMYQYEFSSYVRVAYNIGVAAFCNSTMVKKLLAFDYEGACKGILLFNKVNGRVVQGLVNVRQDEYNECMGAPV